MIIMPYGWSWPIAAAHGPSRLLAPHKLDQEDTVRERPLHVSGHVHREPGLADATDPTSVTSLLLVSSCLTWTASGRRATKLVRSAGRLFAARR
jgi:hypothetical protein